MPTDSSPNVTALVLAAGLSRRMGRSKLLLPWAGATVLDQMLTQIKASSADAVCVVTGGYRERIEPIVAQHGLPHVYNPDFASGDMISSIQVGWRTLAHSDGIMVTLADMPLLTAAIFDKLISTFRQQPDRIIIPTHHGEKGHPVILPAALMPELLALEPPTPPRTVIARHAERVCEVQIGSAAILADIDTPEAYAMVRSQWSVVSGQ